MTDTPLRRGNYVWDYVILAVILAAVMWGLAIYRLVNRPEAPPAPASAAVVSAAADELADTVVALLAGNRPAFIVRAERQFEEDTGCRASLYPAIVDRKEADAERLARAEAIESVQGIYDFVTSAETPAGKGHAAVIVGVQC